MTVKEFAKEQGISTQAVYQRLKAANVDLSAIKKENTADLTPEGAEILRKIFAKNETAKGTKITGYKEIISDLQREIEKLKEEKAAIEKELEERKKDNELWKQQAILAHDSAKAAQDIAIRLQEALEREQQTAQQAQALQLANIQILKDRPRLSLWKRLTGKQDPANKKGE